MPGSTEPTRVRSLRGALPLLRRPPTPQAVRFKPIIDAGDRCQIAAYTDVRFVIDQLNAVAGAHWSARYDELPVSHRSTVVVDDDGGRMLYVRCSLSVFDVTRADVGEGRDGTTFGAGPKAAYSDALKRAAVQFGVNQAIYAMRAPWLAVHDGPSRCPAGLATRSARGDLYVPDETLERLRVSYARWLAGPGSAFGEPIDFGEQDCALGVDGAVAESAGGAEREPAAARTVVADGAQVIAIGAARAESPRNGSDARAGQAAQTALRALAQRTGLDERGAGQLADLLFGEGLLDRLSAEQVAELSRMLEAARATGVTGVDLRVAVDTATSHPNRTAARSALVSQLTRTG